MTEEIWKICPIAPEYMVSNMGRVKWAENDRWASIFTISGYPAVNRSKIYTDTPNQQKVFVHRLIAFTFVDGYEEGYVVNHIDCDKTNNRADNLEWVSSRENIINGYNPRRKYDQDFVDKLYDDMRFKGLTYKALGKKYDVADCYIGKLLYNKVHTKDQPIILKLYQDKLYSIPELSSIYRVDKSVIENIVLKL